MQIFILLKIIFEKKLKICRQEHYFYLFITIKLGFKSVYLYEFKNRK